MKKIRSISAVMLAMVSIMLCFSVTALASDNTQYGLTARITSDKSAYSIDDDIRLSFKVTNTNSYSVNNVSLEALLPDGIVLKNKQDTKKELNSLGAGESISLDVVAAASKTAPSTEPPTVKPGNDDNSQTIAATNNGDASEKGQNAAEVKNAAGGKGIISTGNTVADVFIAVGVLATVAVVFVVVYKKKKKAARVLSAILCLCVVGTSIGAATPIVKAADEGSTQESFTVEHSIKIADIYKTIQARVTYGEQANSEALPAPVLSKTEISLDNGSSGTLSCSDFGGNAEGIIWASSDEAVAKVTVNSDGSSVTIQAVGAGTATITATINGKTVACEVTVPESKDVREDFVDKLLDCKDFWYYSDQGDHKTAPMCGFIDLDLDGNKEFIVQVSGGTLEPLRSFVYYYDNGEIKQANGEFQNVLTLYYDTKQNKYRMMNNFYSSERVNVGSTFNAELFYANHKVESYVYTAGYYSIEQTWTYYLLNKISCVGGAIADNKVISKEEYDQINNDLMEGLVNANMKTKFSNRRDWKNYSTQQIREALLESYDAFSYDRFE